MRLRRISLLALALFALAPPLAAEGEANGAKEMEPGGARILLLMQSSPLAGSQFYALKSLQGQIREGDTLTLAREPDNPHDPRAVRVEW
ncbi:MAG: HIRAN domain-containing protein, partial [Zoogloeaceae bacterium]|nr:HIRAN domain-containing protein [Zoogloeaceae bacterium]